MPFTFLPHQAVVLPLVGRPDRRRWHVDGVALVIATMAPDLFYVLSGTGYAFDSHHLIELLWTSIPLAVVLSIVFRRWVAGPLAANLPEAGRLHLHDYGTVAVRRHTLLATVVAAAIGAVSHVLLDSPTHNDGWLTQHVWFLRWRVLELNHHWYHLSAVLQYAFSFLGAALTLVWLWWAGRHRVLISDGLEPPAYAVSAGSRLRLWGTTAVFCSAGLVVMVATRPVGSIVASFIRGAWLGLAGLGLGAVWAGRFSRR